MLMSDVTITISGPGGTFRSVTTLVAGVLASHGCVVEVAGDSDNDLYIEEASDLIKDNPYRIKLIVDQQPWGG